MSDPDPSSSDTKPPDPRMLEELDEHIRDARAAAEDAVGYEGGPSFVDSGEVSRDEGGGPDEAVEDRTDPDSAEDDQTIAPPG
jgi:hypothetical protein